MDEFYIDISKGVLNTSRLTKKAVQVKGKDGKTFTRMQWVDPNQGSTGHGIRTIRNKEDFDNAIKDGIDRHPEYENALKHQGVDLANHDFDAHPPFHLPETLKTGLEAEVFKNRDNHVPHVKPDEYDVDYISSEDYHRRKYIEEEELEPLKSKPRPEDAPSPKSRKPYRKENPVNLDDIKSYISIGTPVLKHPLVKQGLKEAKEMLDYDFDAEEVEDIMDNIQGGIDDIFGNMTVEGIETALSHPDGHYNMKLDEFVPYNTESGLYGQDHSVGKATMKFHVTDSKGLEMGEVHRIFTYDKKKGGLHIYNAMLALSHDMRGKGHGEDMYSRMEKLWGHMAGEGKTVTIQTTANMDVGVYAWALKGFDFAHEKGAELVRSELRDFLMYNNISGEEVTKNSGIKNLKELKTARDFATLDDGNLYDISEETGYKEPVHLGKAFMLVGQASWEGIKTIDHKGNYIPKDIEKSMFKSVTKGKGNELIKVKRNKKKIYVGKEGLSVDSDKNYTHNDYWLHKDVMEDPNIHKGLYIDMIKGRKSLDSLDVSIKKRKPTKHEQLIIDLGLQDVSKDLITNVITRKSESIIIDLQKADNKHLPKDAERFSYNCNKNRNIVYIPVNRLKQVYQTDKALNPSTVNRKAKEMKSGKEMPPVYIGYDYDVHDGHHSWHAAIKNDYTHVPCEVVGNDPEKVKEAINKYKEVWKSFREDFWQPKPKQKLEKTDRNPNLIIDENQRIDPVEDEKVWEEKVDENDKKFRSQLGIEKSQEIVGELSLVLDLSKALNRGKLVKKRTMVKGKGGKVFYRMQWVDPNDKSANLEHPGVDHSTYAHHEDGIKDLERRQSNRFPVVHHPTKDLKNTDHNYNTNKEKYAEAEKKLKNGEKLPPVKINHKGEILENHHLVDLAKKHGLSHVPSIVMGNTELKKKLEDKLKDKVVAKDDEGKVEPVGKTDKPLEDKEPNQGTSTDMVSDLDTFKNVTKKKYTKQHLMESAKKHGITWKTHLNDGTELPENSNILWMHAHQAIVNFIKAGNRFEVSHDKKDVTKRMNQEGKDSIHQHFLELFEKHGGGNKTQFIEWAKNNGIMWKEQSDPSINWKNLVVEVKSQLAKGKMVGGVRTRQKEAMKEANTVVTDQIKSMVKAYGTKYGKSSVMEKAESLGIEFSRFTKKGDQLPENSNILWMRASESIARHIAQGGEFKMGGQDEETGIVSQTGDYGEADMSPMQALAVDAGKRNSRNMENELKDWAIKALMVDRELDESQAGEMYNDLMQKARNTRVMVHIDPLELLPNGSTLLDQLSSDGHLKNDYELNRGLDRETREVAERDMFGDDYDEASDKERPVYGSADMLNRGLESNKHAGSVAFVLKPETTSKRTTGSAIAGTSIPYGEEGKWVRSMEDPHHLVIDRWRSRWKNVNKRDKQRSRMFDSVLEGTKHREDSAVFEAHLHGGLNFSKDVDHVLVPQSWKTDSQHKEKHEKITNFANQFGFEVKYEG